MTFDGISVDHNSMREGSANLLSQARGIQSRLDDLENDLKPLQSDWTGSARESYRIAKDKWDRAIADMILLLQDTGTSVDQSNQDYEAADRRGAGRFGG